MAREDRFLSYLDIQLGLGSFLLADCFRRCWKEERDLIGSAGVVVNSEGYGPHDVKRGTKKYGDDASMTKCRKRA
jgi:hypothetical protein